MTKPSKDRKCILIAVAVLLLIAYICRIPGIGGRFSRELGLIRSAIYMGLFLAWGLSVRSRILQTQARRYMTAIACLMIFWFLVRTLKFHFLTSDRYPDAARYLWYLYYLPMLFIPLLSVFVAFSIGKPEDYHLPKRAALLLLPTAMLFLLVMTNDLHQRVFTFPRGMTGENGYAVGYYLVGGWLTICALMLLFVLYHKCRIPGSRRRILLPCLPIVILILYAVLHYSQMEWVRFVAGDMTAVMCLMYAATLELCIQCRFIQSNTHYRELFDASTVGAQIADGDNHVCLRSQTARLLPEAVLRQAQSSPIMLEGGIRLCSAPMRGGRVFWQEDVSGLLSVLEQLSDTREELRGYGALLEEENKQKQRRRELEEQKRLFDAVQEIVAPAMARLGELISRLNAAEDRETARMLHGKIAVTGAYIKRRSNLVFLADQTGEVAAKELMLCLNESASNLRLAGTACAVGFELSGSMDGRAAGRLYDFFEAAVEAVREPLPGLNALVTENGQGYHMTLMLQCGAVLPELTLRFPEASVEQDEEVCYCSLRLPKGGGQA